MEETPPISVGRPGDFVITPGGNTFYNNPNSGWEPYVNLKGQDGKDGEKIEIQKGSDAIQYKYENEESWIDLVALVDLKGTDGKDGREIELQRGDATLQWRWLGDDLWKDLVTLEELKGDPGKDGEDGSKWYTGTTAPASGLGVVGDFYLRSTTGVYYLKTASGWQSQGSLQGPKGDKGDPGEDGTDGSDGQDGTEWFTGPFPDPNVGRYRDLFLTADGNYYRKSLEGSWSLLGSLKGPPGESLSNLIRARFIHVGSGFFDMDWGDDDFKVQLPEPLGSPADGVMISWDPGRSAAVIHISTGEAQEWGEPLIPEIVDQDETTAIVRFKAPGAGFYDYPIWMNVIIVGDK